MPTPSRKTILLATDQQRSVLIALDANQAHPIAYTPYGHRLLENGVLSRLGFNGEQPDPLTGHYHLGNGYRQFNPVLMRFNSPDSWSPFGEGGLNAYAYCDGEPISQSDPTGHFSLKWLNPLRWLSSSKLKSGTVAPKKLNMKKNILAQYNNPKNMPLSEETIVNSGPARLHKNKLYLEKETTLKNGFTLYKEHLITVHKSSNTHSIGTGKIYHVEYTGSFDLHKMNVAKYANLKIQHSRPIKLKDFSKIIKKSPGMLAGDLQEIRRA